MSTSKPSIIAHALSLSKEPCIFNQYIDNESTYSTAKGWLIQEYNRFQKSPHYNNTFEQDVSFFIERMDENQTCKTMTTINQLLAKQDVIQCDSDGDSESDSKEKTKGSQSDVNMEPLVIENGKNCIYINRVKYDPKRTKVDLDQTNDLPLLHGFAMPKSFVCDWDAVFHTIQSREDPSICREDIKTLVMASPVLPLNKTRQLLKAGKDVYLRKVNQFVPYVKEGFAYSGYTQRITQNHDNQNTITYTIYQKMKKDQQFKVNLTLAETMDYIQSQHDKRILEPVTNVAIPYPESILNLQNYITAYTLHSFQLNHE